MSDTIITSLTQPLTNATIYEDTFIYKGQYLVEMDIGPISEKNTRAITVTIDWGDGAEREVYKRDVIFNYRTSSIFSEVLDGRLGGSILGKYTHRYTPSQTHIRAVSAQIVIAFDNGMYTKIVQPISLVMESYYDNIKEFSINSMVVHDSTMFSILNLQSKYNNWTWPALWADNQILETSIFPPRRPVVDPPPDEPPPNPCQVFQCTGDPDHPTIECPPGFKFNCTTCKCERILPPLYPPCNYPNYPNYPTNYPLCYSVDTYNVSTDFMNSPLIVDPFGFNLSPINPDT